MNRKKIFFVILIFIAVASAFTFGYNKLLAATDTLYVGLSKFYSNNFGYSIKDPNNGGMRIWKIQAYKDAEGTEKQTKNLYCIKAGYGNTWNNSSENILTYNERYNLLNKSDIATNSSSDVVKEIVNGNYYGHILWILDRAYAPTGNASLDAQNKTSLLKAAGIIKDEETGNFVYTPSTKYDYVSSVNSDFYADGYSIGLTDDDIKVVQQAAIWYYTNYGETLYNQYNTMDWLNYTENGTSYSALSGYHQMTTEEGKMRNDQMTVLYKYLIDSAKNNSTAYKSYVNELKSEYGYKDMPFIFNTKNLSIEQSRYKLNVVRKNGKYIIGPISGTVANESEFDITLNLYDQDNKPITDYKIVNAEGTEIKTTITELLKKGQEFYISTSSDGIKEIKIDAEVKYTKVDANVWMVEGKEEQPLVELNKEDQKLKTEYIAVPITGTYKVQIKKVDQDGNILKEAVFNINGNTINTVDGIGLLEANAEITSTDKIVKNYVISETTAPDGYIGIPGGNISLEGTVIEQDNKYVVSEANITTTIPGVKASTENNVITIEIPNSLKSGKYNLKLIKSGIDKDGNVKKITDATAKFEISKSTQGYAETTETKDVTGELDIEKNKAITKETVNLIDTYTIKELVPPDEYSKFDGTITIKVHKKELTNGYVVDTAKTEVTAVDGNGNSVLGVENAPVYYDLDTGTVVVTVLNEKIEKTGKYNLKLVKAEKDENGTVKEITDSKATFEVIKNTKTQDGTEGTPSTETKEVTGNLILENNKEITKDTVEIIDTYTIKETVPPDGYSKFDGTIIIEVHKKEVDGVYVIDTEKTVKKVLDASGKDITAETNVPVYFDITTDQLVVTVIDEELEKKGNYDLTLVKAEKDLEGNIKTITSSKATFEVTKNTKTQDGTEGTPSTETKEVTGTLALEKNKEITKDTVEIIDTYTIKELVPPDEYSKFDGTIIIEVHKKEVNGEYVVDTEKTVKKVLDASGKDITAETNVPVYFDIRTGKLVVTVINEHKEKKEFDLALRKVITKIEDESGKTKSIKNAEGKDNTRGEIVPDISTINQTKTAKYSHRKDPVVVEENDIVTYSLIVYNEGEQAGTATKIVDQLPTGLILKSGISEVKSSTGNVYKIEYSAVSNQVTLTLKTKVKEIPAFDGKTLSSEKIEIKCKVTAEPDESKSQVLTNVAWILEEYNADEKKTITSEKNEDRDSTPSEHPNVNKNNTSDYKGNKDNKSDLSDNSNYYKGEEDDDDFEKVEVLPVPKSKFDLALRKYITAISEDSKIEEGEYITDTKKSTGKYVREPSITVESGKIKYTHPKTPLKVANGNYIEYTIRVYNEGEEAGYAEEVTDYIYKNQGLQYVKDSEINAKYGWKMYDKDGKETTEIDKAVKIKTDYLSKAKEEKEGANLINAFDSSKDISSTNPDYKELKIVFKVTEKNSSKNKLINIAEISEDADKDGKKVDDIDSTPGSDSKKYPDEKGPETEDHEDDIDYDVVEVKYFDLSLFKFIAAISEDSKIDEGEYITDTKKSTGTYTRAPIVEKIAKDGTITYKEHNKEPLLVKEGDYVLYTIRVYNEGEIAGYASEIKDTLPEGLEFVVEDKTYNGIWTLKYNNGKQEVTTNWYAKGKGAEEGALQGEAGYNANLLKALDPNSEISKDNPDYIDAYVLCKVTEKEDSSRVLVNQAQISDDQGPNGEEIDDKDSTPDEWKDGDDDQDIEKVKLYCFDLSLRKFITEVNGEKLAESREPKVDISKMGTKDENGKLITTATYIHSKEPLTLVVGNVVTYTIRVYNEGEIAGYAAEIEDDIPDYLEFLPEDTVNKEYGWVMYDKEGNKTNKVDDAISVKTIYLSKENEKTPGENLIKAKEANQLNFKDVKISFKIKDPSSTETIITNYAQISKNTDENGNDLTDRDSTPGKWEDGDDDQDVENVKVEYFDLSLIKYLSKVIVKEDGKEKVIQTGYNREINNTEQEKTVKVEIDRKKLKTTEVRFVYTIEVKNEGQIPGYAKEITDYIPEGLEFIASENEGWEEKESNVITTRMLEKTLLQPEETASVQVTLKWKNGNDNFGAKVNTAEISEDYNDKGVPDRDSTPGNKEPNEDDIDTAEVVLNIKTGIEKTYFGLTLIVLVTVAGGIALIKKFVL